MPFDVLLNIKIQLMDISKRGLPEKELAKLRFRRLTA
jgi:hypothetical protein